MFTSAEAQTNFNSRKWGWERSPCTSYQRRPPERGRLVQSVGAHPSFGTRPQSPDTAFFGLSCPRPSSWKCGSCTQTVGLEQEQRKAERGRGGCLCLLWALFPNVLWMLFDNLMWSPVISKCKWSIPSVCFHCWTLSAFVLSPSMILSALEQAIVFYFPVTWVFPGLKHSSSKRMRFLQLWYYYWIPSPSLSFPPSLPSSFRAGHRALGHLTVLAVPPSCSSWHLPEVGRWPRPLPWRRQPFLETPKETP